MSDIFIDLGFIAIKWYSIILLLAFIIGIFILKLESKKFKIDSDYITNLIFWTIVIGLVGARLYYVMFNLDFYVNNFLDIFKVWEGGLAIHGGILFGASFIILYTHKYKVKTLRITDIVAPALLIGQAIGRWGNFFNKEAHGPEVTLSFLQNLKLPNFIIEGMNINGIYYHPTFLYESIWNLIGFIVLIIIRNKKRLKLGTITSIYLMWYSVGRFAIETLRTDSLMFGTFKAAQFISVILFLFGALIFLLSRKGAKLDNLYKEKEDTNLKF